MKLTVKSTPALKLPPGKTDHIFWEDDIPGFGLRIREGGSRNWVFQYALGKKQRRMSLGSAMAITVADARKTAAQLQARVRLGEDPAGVKVESKQKAAETFEAIARKFLAHQQGIMRPDSYTQVERHILKYAKPLHGLQVAGLHRRTIVPVIDALHERGATVTANRARATLNHFFMWSIGKGYIEQNPLIGTTAYEEQSRERVLEDHLLIEIWRQVGDDQYGSIVRLLMLSLQREDEIAAVCRSELKQVEVPKSRIEGIELPAFTIDAIELPGERTKNKRPQIVPLSKPALAILEKQPVRMGNDGAVRDLIFGTGQGGFSGWSKSKERIDRRVLKGLRKVAEDRGDQALLAYVAKVESLKVRIAKLKGDERKKLRMEELDPIWWKLHDLRRTADTVMNERLGVLPHVVDCILNHVSKTTSGKSGVAGVYNRALYLRERVAALRLWGDHVMALVGENVVPLRTAGTS